MKKKRGTVVTTVPLQYQGVYLGVQISLPIHPWCNKKYVLWFTISPVINHTHLTECCGLYNPCNKCSRVLMSVFCNIDSKTLELKLRLIKTQCWIYMIHAAQMMWISMNIEYQLFMQQMMQNINEWRISTIHAIDVVEF